MTTPILLTSYNTVNSKPNQLNLNLPLPQTFRGEEVALSKLILYNSWRNITAAYGNNTVSYIFNGTTYSITFDDVFLTIEDISGYIQQQMQNRGQYLLDNTGTPVYFISLATNIAYYAATLTCTPIPTSLPTGWTNPNSIALSGQVPQLVITNANFGLLIGFATGTYPATAQSTQYMVNSTIVPQIAPVTSVNVCLNMVNNCRFNSYPNVIHTFSTTVAYASQIVEQPQNLVFYPLTDGTYNAVTITLRDQNNRDLPIVDTTGISATLIVRKRG